MGAHVQVFSAVGCSSKFLSTSDSTNTDAFIQSIIYSGLDPEQQCMLGAVAHILILLLKLLEISHRVLLPMASRVPLLSPSISSAVYFLPQGGPFTALVSGSCQRVESVSKTCYWSLVLSPLSGQSWDIPACGHSTHLSVCIQLPLCMLENHKSDMPGPPTCSTPLVFSLSEYTASELLPT